MKDRDQKERRSNGGMLTATNKIRYSLSENVSSWRWCEPTALTPINTFRMPSEDRKETRAVTQ